MDGARRDPTNVWMVGLTVLWCAVLAIAIVLAILGGNADSLTYDQPGLPPSEELAGIYYACSGVAVAVALVVIGIQLGVGALRWYLDPESRPRMPEVVGGERRPARQDF